MRQLALLLMLLACASGSRAQATYDVFGGKLTNADGSVASTCSAYNPNYNYTNVSITGNGTTATATITSGSFYTSIASTVFPKSPIYVIGGTNSGFDVMTGTGVLATVTSATTLTFPSTTNGSGTGYTVAAGGPWVQEVNKHWWWCTPLGHEIFPEGPTYAPDTIHGSTNLAGVNQRLQYMGFNTIQVGANGNLYPTNASQTVRMPFLPSINAAYYSVTNVQSCGGLPLANPVKDMFKLRPSAYNGYAGYIGAADYYDANMLTWLEDDLSCDTPWGSGAFKMGNSPNLGYALGIASDDSDNMSGISGGGPDFATIPAGQNTYNMGFFVATISPLETAMTSAMARSGANFVYTNTQIYSKLQLRNALAEEYGTIGAMNAAWGSNYTTFDSSGTCVGSQPITCASSVVADSVGTGDGTTLTFSAMLSHHTGIAAFSVQLLVSGIPVAGTISAEGSAAYSWYGPNVASGSVNPTTGALTVTFSAGHAPASSAAITATYVDCGWGCGTGFLDEDDRASHQAWMGHDFIAMSGAAMAVQTDINTFFQSIAGQYFSTMRTGIKSVFPWMLYMGPNTLGTWASVPAAPVLKAAGQECDAFISGGGGSLYTAAELAYIFSNYGNKPMMMGWYTSANADSAVDSPFPSGPNTAFDFQTQAARALNYFNGVNAELSTASFDSGDFPYAGVYWWEYFDQNSQTYADGVVTLTDNAYNASDAVPGSVTCAGVTATPNGCGGEPPPTGSAGATRPYGNLLSGTNGVINANLLWTAKNYGATVPMLPPLNLGISVAKASGKSSGSSQGKK